MTGEAIHLVWIAGNFIAIVLWFDEMRVHGQKQGLGMALRIIQDGIKEQEEEVK